MIICDLYIIEIPLIKAEVYPVLIVDSNTILPIAVPPLSFSSLFAGGTLKSFKSFALLIMISLRKAILCIVSGIFLENC